MRLERGLPWQKRSIFAVKTFLKCLTIFFRSTQVALSSFLELNALMNLLKRGLADKVNFFEEIIERFIIERDCMKVGIFLAKLN